MMSGTTSQRKGVVLGHAAIRARLDAVARAMQPYRSARSYMNFADRQADPRGAFDAVTYGRLRRVKAAYDPDDVIRDGEVERAYLGQ